MGVARVRYPAAGKLITQSCPKKIHNRPIAASGRWLIPRFNLCTFDQKPKDGWNSSESTERHR